MERASRLSLSTIVLNSLKKFVMQVESTLKKLMKSPAENVNQVPSSIFSKTGLSCVSLASTELPQTYQLKNVLNVDQASFCRKASIFHYKKGFQAESQHRVLGKTKSHVKIHKGSFPRIKLD